MWWVTVVVIGFSLDKSHVNRAPSAPVETRRMQETVVELCQSSCDSGEDAECDEMDSTGAYTRSCDMHPTTSCDTECTFPAAPPALPYTDPPPPPPKASPELFALGLALLMIAVMLLSFSCAWLDWRNARRNSAYRRSFSYWCCCLVPCMRWLERANQPSSAEEPREGSTERQLFPVRSRPPDSVMPGLFQLAL